MYAVWADKRHGPNRVQFSYSEDWGSTWSEPILVASDVPDHAHSYQAAIAVNNAGVVGIVWFDTRHSEQNEIFDVYFTASTDGGRSFLPARRVSSASSRPQPWERGGYDHVRHLSGGDYINMTADEEGVFHPLWPDARSGIIDGQQFMVIPDVVPGEPFYISDPSVPGGRQFNAAAFVAPPRHPQFPAAFARQGNFGRNVLREHPLYQTDVSVARSFPVANATRVTFRWDVFNLFNHPMFGGYGEQHTIPAAFGVPTQTRGRSLGGLSHLYQIGGPRSMQASLRVEF